MPAFNILGDEVVTRADYLERTAQKATHAIQAMATAGPLAAAFNIGQFTDIGLNLPLSILIRYVYTGKHPKSLFGGPKPMTVVSGLRGYATYAPASRAVNFLTDRVSPKQRFTRPSAFDAGTNVVSYSPAVLTDSFNFTVEMAFDRFPDKLFSTISSALKTLSSVPLLIPAQGYLLAASTLISTGAEWADALIDGRAVFSVSDGIDFNLPGKERAAAEFRVLTHDENLKGMKFDADKGLITTAGTQYDGDEPYIVISLDGAVRNELKDFAPTIAAASVMKQFFNMRDLGEASAEAILSGARLVNDLKYRGEAINLKAQANKPGIDDAEKKKLQDRLEAVLKNISEDALKPPT